MHRFAWVWIVVACGNAEEHKALPPPAPVTPDAAAKPPPPPSDASSERPLDDQPPPPVAKVVEGDCTKKNGDAALIAVCEYRCRERKDGDACAIAASKYYQGDGAKVDRAKGSELIKRACELESADGCVYLTRLETWRTDELTSKIATYYERDCQAGTLTACIDLALRVRAFDEPRAKTLIEKALEQTIEACTTGEGWLCVAAAQVLEAAPLGIDRNVMRAAELRTKACDGGHATSCLDLSAATSKDDKRQALVDKACALGLRKACAQVALEQASKNTTQAAKAIERACELGAGNWCVRIGEDFAKANQRDKAIEMFTRACQLGDEHGCSQARALGAK